MRTWFYRLPAAARALITGVLSAAAMFGVVSLYTVAAPWGDSQQSVVARLVVSTIAGLLIGVLGVVFGDRRIRRVYGSADRALEYQHALRTGELPGEIDPAVWQGWLTVSSQANRWAPATVGTFAVLAVLQLIGHEWMLAALMALFAIWQLAVALVVRRRIARLSAAIGRRQQSLGLP
jgi:phosphate/sulfate permease